MAEAATAHSDKVYTLTQVSKITDISMPTLQRYKKLYQDRIPSRGDGRSQRYLEGALDIFRALKEENIGRRGRPRKTGAPASPRTPAKVAPKKAATAAPAKPGRKPAVAEKAAPVAAGGLLTLTQVGKLTGVSYPTLLRYVRLHLKEIPHKGSGRNRRFLPESVEVFKRLREESPRGRQPKEKKAAAPKAAAPKAAAPKAAAPKAAAPNLAAKATAKPAAPVVKKKVGRPPKAAAPAAPVAAAPAAGDSALAARVKELEKVQKQLEKLVSKLEKEVGKPYKLVLQRK